MILDLPRIFLIFTSLAWQKLIDVILEHNIISNVVSQMDLNNFIQKLITYESDEPKYNRNKHDIRRSNTFNLHCNSWPKLLIMSCSSLDTNKMSLVQIQNVAGIAVTALTKLNNFKQMVSFLNDKTVAVLNSLFMFQCFLA